MAMVKGDYLPVYSLVLVYIHLKCIICTKMQLEFKLASTTPPIQVSTGLLLPPLVTRETRLVCTSLLVIDASSALGARSLHETWRRGREKFYIWFMKLKESPVFHAEMETSRTSPVRLGRPGVWGWTHNIFHLWSLLHISEAGAWGPGDQVPV